MTRHFGLSFYKVTADPALRGVEQLDRPHIAPSPRDSNIVSFPGALPPDVPVNLGGDAAPFTQWLIDVAAVAAALLLIVASAASIPLAVFLLFFAL